MIPLQDLHHSCLNISIVISLPPIGSPNAGLFFSFAVLSNLERVDVCYVDERCTGMLIRYVDSPPVVLGQWHASHASQWFCIYNGSEPGITHIYFRISKSSRIVTGISFSPDTVGTTLDSDCAVFSTGEVRLQAALNVQHLLTYSCSTLPGGSQNAMIKSCAGREVFHTSRRRV
jgi:hypothetical protein